jgi:hypothetical protein
LAPAINHSALRHRRHGDPQKLCQEALARGRRAWRQCALPFRLYEMAHPTRFERVTFAFGGQPYVEANGAKFYFD